MKTPETITAIKTGHEYLRELCSFNADFNAFKPKVNPITNRVNYIQYQLTAMNLPFETDMFNSENPEKLNMTATKFVNLYVSFKAEKST